MTNRILARAPRSILIAAAALLLALAAASCAGNASYRRAEAAARLEDWDDAVLGYLDALEKDPGNIAYRSALLRAKIKSSQAHFEKGKQFEKAGVPERALVELQEAVQLDPTNQYAGAQLEHVRRLLAAQNQAQENSTIEQRKQKVRNARPQPPVLNPRSDQPISLEFPQPTSIFKIYRALGQAMGINVLFDPNLKDQEIPIELHDVTPQQALERLMTAGGHFYKVEDEHTILIAADTPPNRRLYEDLVIQNFFLSNADLKEVTTILRSLIDAPKLAVNEQLNNIVFKSTADKVKVAQKIIETNDKAKAEVVVDIELLQINTTRMRNLGINLSDYSVTQSLDLGGTGTTTPNLHISDIPFLTQANWALKIPSFIYNFMKQNGEAQLIAQPKMRLTEGEKGNLIIGDKIPIPLTTFNTQNAVPGGGIVPITSFQYQDVGVKIEIEPRVHHNQEVTLKLKIEVSNLGQSITFGGQTQPTIGTRSIDSTIRLKDGETNFLAGLIRTDESTTDNGVPGVSEIPILGRLFSNKNTSHTRTDLVLTLTPHIIRNAEITEEDLLPIWVGTEANTSFRGATPRVESTAEGPFDGNEGTPEEMQEAIRRRLQRLPRGLRPAQEGGAAAPPPPAPGGVNLAPVAPPTDIFRRPTSQQPQPPGNPAVPPPVPQPGVVQPPPSGGQISELRQPAGAAKAAAEMPLADRPVPLHAASGTSLAARQAAASSQLSGAPAADASGAPSVRRTAARPPATVPGVVKAANRSPDPDRQGSGNEEDVEEGAAVRLWLAPQQREVHAGDRFEVWVQVAVDQPISHLPFTLGFDPQHLAVESVQAGDFLTGGAASGTPGAPASPAGPVARAEVLASYSRPGEVVVGASRLGEVPGVKGAGTLARVTFRALTAGTAVIGFSAHQALDGALRPVLPISVQPARVEVISKPLTLPPSPTVRPVMPAGKQPPPANVEGQ